MTDDCVFESSGGDGVCGTRCEGTEAVRKGYSKSWKNFRMPSGAMLAILCTEIEASLNGCLQVQMQMANDQKFRGAIFLHSELERYWLKILIERIDH
jgi:hypothetical protein